MSIFEEIFDSAILDVVVPDTSIQFPVQSQTDPWLESLQNEEKDVHRDLAFFDEILSSLLLIRLAHPTINDSPDPTDPPGPLLDFLAHLQISLEATYISPHSAIDPPPLAGRSHLSAPPRPESLLVPGRVKSHPTINSNLNPSIFPPATPNPTPSTTETDQKYVQAEGTLLLAGIWGQGHGQGLKGGEENKGRFTLLWSESEQVWVAVYQLALVVCTSLSSIYLNQILFLNVLCF